jgi:CRP/FNR family transcriptional regulator, cyclic AMP receptor protein
MRFQVPERVRLLDVLPGLAADLDPRATEDAAAFLLSPAVHVLKGDWDAAAASHGVPVRGRVLGFVVLDGLILRESQLGAVPSTQVLGPGSLVLDTGESDTPVPVDRRMRALVTSRVALLDDTVLMAGLRWPRLMGRLLDAAGAEVERSCRYHAISQLPRAEDRVLAMLWELAGQFGRVTGNGVHVGLSLTHEVLGTLIGARRPTVSLALVELTTRGALRTDSGGEWVLEPDSAQLVAAPAAMHVAA